MRKRTLALAAAAGATAFLAVGAVVSEVLLPYVEFSVLVGLPAGVAAGALAAVAAVLFLGFGATVALVAGTAAAS